jgi:hypothetical protein
MVCSFTAPSRARLASNFNRPNIGEAYKFDKMLMQFFLEFKVEKLCPPISLNRLHWE